MKTTTSLKDLEQKLYLLYRQKLRVDALTFGLLMFFAALIGLFCIFMMDYMTDFPMALRITMTAVILLVCFIVLPRKRSKGVVKDKNILQITCEVESKASKETKGGFQSLLISAVEFSENPAIGGSEDLKTNVINDAQLPEYNPSNIKLYSKARIRLMYRLGGLMLFLYILWGALGHNSMLTFFQRAVGINSLYLTNTQIISIEAPKYLAQFEDVPIVITISGKKPTSGMILVDLDNGEGFEVALLPEGKDSNKYSGMVKQAENSFKFQVVIGDAYKQKRYVEVIPPPVINSANIKVTPPKYTKLPVKEEKFGPLELVQGSDIVFHIVPDRPIQSCFLVYNSKEYPMKKENDGYSLQTAVFQESGTYSFKLVDEKGISNNKRLDFPLTLITDRPASIEVTKPTEGTYYAPISKMKWDMSLSDDYGLAELILKYIVYKRNAEAVLISVKKGTIPLRTFNDEREAKVNGVIELQQLKLEPGQVLGVEFVIKDHKPGRKDADQGSSGILQMNIVSAAELKQIIESEMIGVKNIIKDIQTDIKFQSKRIEIFRKKGGESL